MSEARERTINSSDARGPATEGLEHLQAAALELIAAARSFLDVVEGVVRDPSVLIPAPDLGRDDDEPGEGRVRHIRVS